MKKYLSIVLVIALALTLMVPFSVSAAPGSDIFVYFYEKEVNPYMFSGAMQSFISFENIGNGYTLRSTEDTDMICEEISVFLSSYGVTKDEVLPYVTDFLTFFADKPDLFKVMMSFVINTENIILPFTKQDALIETVPGTISAIRDNFYSETLFLNCLSKTSEKYQEATGKMAIKLVDERMMLMSDVVDYVDFLQSDEQMADAFISTITNTTDIINDGDVEEKLNYADYLILIGVLSLEMDDTVEEDDPVSVMRYDELYKNYNGGTESIAAFENISHIVNEYAQKINGESVQFEKNRLIDEAMTKASTIKILSSEIKSDNKAVIDISDGALIEFASLCGKKVRSELVKKGISVSKNQNYSLIFEFDDSTDISGFRLTIPYDTLSVLSEKNVMSIYIKSSQGGYVINIDTFLQSEMVSGNSVTFSLKAGAAENIIPGLEIYAQGNKVIKVSLSGDSDYSGAISYGAMRFSKNVSGEEDKYGENNIYSIASNGDRKKVSRYSIVDSQIYFEIGEGRSFAKIEGELTKPNPDAGDDSDITDNPGTSQTPSTKPSGGSTWVEGSDSSTNNNDRNKEDNNNKEENQNNTPAVTPQPGTSTGVEFDDVPDSHWAKAYIENLASKGILSGVGNNKFAPDANVTREQFAKILTMAFGIVNENAQCDFEDVENDSWYKVYVASAYEKGIINGIGEGLFGTGQNISRQDMATMILRAAKACSMELGEKSTHSYNDDAHISDYAFEAVKVLAGSGAISGYEDNTFRPKNPSTRAQVAKIVSEILKYKK